MKINGIKLTANEKKNLTEAIKYAISNNGKVVVEEQLHFLSHTRSVTVMVYTSKSWSKAFDLTDGTITNICEDDDGDRLLGDLEITCTPFIVQDPISMLRMPSTTVGAFANTVIKYFRDGSYITPDGDIEGPDIGLLMYRHRQHG